MSGAVDTQAREGTSWRRVAALFRPYRGRLTTVLVLIAVSAGLGMVSPFLLRDVLDVAIPEDDDRLLVALVAGMIGISIATGVLGVAQTWLSNVVGQRVMHDLRAQVYRHLQRLSLAFFTKTRTGEITLQGRVLPIGGLKQKVLAAHAAGLTEVILPERNRGDLDDVPADVREAMTFHPVMSIDEVLEQALEPTPAKLGV